MVLLRAINGSMFRVRELVLIKPASVRSKVDLAANGHPGLGDCKLASRTKILNDLQDGLWDWGLNAI